MLDYIQRIAGGEALLQLATRIRDATVAVLYGLVDALYSHGWMHSKGKIAYKHLRYVQGVSCNLKPFRYNSRTHNFRYSPPRHQQYLEERHIVMDSAYKSMLETPRNPFLFPAEAVFARVCQEIFLEHKCVHAAKFLEMFLLNPFRRDFVIRQWLGHGLLDLQDLLAYERTFAPSGIVAFED
jgi:hypothetical protein